jgi:hypothetical protein
MGASHITLHSPDHDSGSYSSALSNQQNKSTSSIMAAPPSTNGSTASSFMIVDAEGYDPATVALIGFLRCEADLADKKAESLRAQATHLAAQFGITDDIQERYGKLRIVIYA